jgi:hypothetical protein
MRIGGFVLAKQGRKMTEEEGRTRTYYAPNGI